MAPKLLPPELLYEIVFFLPVDDVVPNAFVSCRMLHDFLLPRAIKLKFLMEQLRQEIETLRQSQQSHQKEIESLRSELKSIQSELQSARQIIATLPHGRRAAAESEAEATDVEMRPDEEEEGGGADGLPGISTELVQILEENKELRKKIIELKKKLRERDGETEIS